MSSTPITEDAKYWHLWKNADDPRLDSFEFKKVQVEWGMSPENLVRIRRLSYPKSEWSKKDVEMKAIESADCPHCKVGHKLEEENPTLFSDPTKTFIDNSCGDGEFLGEIVIRKMERSGCSLEKALSTTYGVDIMEDNIEECKKRLAGPEPTPEILEILNKNIVCADGLIYEYLFE